MKVEQQFSDPDHVKDRRAYRVRIEGRDGQVIEIVEQMGGGFSIAAELGGPIVVQPIDFSKVIVRAVSR